MVVLSRVARDRVADVRHVFFASFGFVSFGCVMLGVLVFQASATFLSSPAGVFAGLLLSLVSCVFLFFALRAKSRAGVSETFHRLAVRRVVRARGGWALHPAEVVLFERAWDAGAGRFLADRLSPDLLEVACVLASDGFEGPLGELRDTAALLGRP